MKDKIQIGHFYVLEKWTIQILLSPFCQKSEKNKFNVKGHLREFQNPSKTKIYSAGSKHDAKLSYRKWS